MTPIEPIPPRPRARARCILSLEAALLVLAAASCRPATVEPGASEADAAAPALREAATSPLLTLRSRFDAPGVSPFSADAFVLDPVTLLERGVLKALTPSLYGSRKTGLPHVAVGGEAVTALESTDRSDEVAVPKESDWCSESGRWTMWCRARCLASAPAKCSMCASTMAAGPRALAMSLPTMAGRVAAARASRWAATSLRRR